MRFSVITAAIFGSTLALAHMEISDPAPFRSKKNPHSNQNTIDYSMTSPLDASGGKLCKGYEVDFADTSGVGAATGTYAQGSSQAVQVMGSARHDGGSCQVSLSTDSAKTFTVLMSVQGGCPGADGSKIPFTVPADAPVGRAILSWSWMGKTGGRPEMYQNCAAVEITSGSGPAPAVAFSARPPMFIANIGTGCSTVGGKDTRYPNPGPDVVGTGDEGSTTGNCGSAALGGAPVPESSANLGIPVASSSTSKFSFAPSTGSLAATTLATSSVLASSTADPISTGTPPTGLTVSTDGTCGANKKCPQSTCCSSSGYCGSSAAHCGTGCQAAFGICSGGNNTIKGRSLAGRIRQNQVNHHTLHHRNRRGV